MNINSNCLAYLFFGLIILSACTKESKHNTSIETDVSQQWLIDPLGNVLIRTNDT
jgi:hypothetical protein